MRDITVSAVQMDSGLDRAENLSRAEALIRQASRSDLVALPEVFGVRGANGDYRAHAEPVPGPTTERLGTLAAELGLWILAGSLVEADAGRCFNTSVLLDRQGRLKAKYRKIHLFEAALDTGQRVCEEDTFTPGTEPVMAEVEGWRCGLAVCYDLRFPELFRYYAARGAHLFFLPANFTQRTGRDHWEVLVRARAIENQCFVIAPAQCGANRRTGIASHGHSLIVDPWGTILAEGEGGEQVLRAELLADRMHEIRSRIPVLRHRKL